MNAHSFRRFGAASAIAATLTLLASEGHAEPTLRKQVDQNGDFLLFGNALGWDCSENASNVIVGTANCTSVSNSNSSDTAIDLYWLADAPEAGTALASTSTIASAARSKAALVLPSGAQVSYARIYWAAYQPANGSPGRSIDFEVPQKLTVTSIDAEDCFTAFAYGTSGEFWYQCTADVTELVQTSGAGVYAVSGVQSVNNLVGANNQVALSGWSVVVFYASPNEPTRNLTLFDGLDAVTTQSSRTTHLTGFLVPNSGYRAKLGVLAYEGDNQNTGDQLLFNGAILTDALNPESNFFNSTRSTLGVGDDHDGDLPRLTGAPGSMGGMDLDVIDVTAHVHAGDTAATIVANSTSDRFALGAFVTSISTLRPDLSALSKRVVDLNGGAVRPNDLLEYIVTAQNNGNDTAIETVLVDPLPAGVTYVPGSLTVDTPRTAVLTDANDEDAGQFDALNRTLTVRLSTATDDTRLGMMAPNTSSTIRFRVQVNTDADGNLDNQASITAAGLLGAPSATYFSDGNGNELGSQTTSVQVIGGCMADSECATTTPYCAPGNGSRVCVGCLADADCGTNDSGRICIAHVCAPGCRTSNGNACPLGFTCVLNATLTGSCERQSLDAGLEDAGSELGTGGSTVLPDAGTTQGGRIAMPAGGAGTGAFTTFTTTSLVLPATGGAPVLSTTIVPLNTGGAPNPATTTAAVNSGGVPAVASGGAAIGGAIVPAKTTTRANTGGTRTMATVTQTYSSETANFEGAGCQCRTGKAHDHQSRSWLRGVALLLASICVMRRRRKRLVHQCTAD